VANFTGNVFGGLIAALIALPYGLALASAMGLPPNLGVVTSVVTAPVTALLGRNPVTSSGGTPGALGTNNLRQRAILPREIPDGTFRLPVRTRLSCCALAERLHSCLATAATA
jgi:hypothetical protein